MRNLFANLPTDLSDEVVESLVKGTGVRIERIISTGHSSPDGFWYDQDEDEWVVLLRGAARLVFADEPQPVELRPGDFGNLPAHRKHRVAWTTPDEPTIWLAVHYSEGRSSEAT